MRWTTNKISFGDEFHINFSKNEFSIINHEPHLGAPLPLNLSLNLTTIKSPVKFHTPAAQKNSSFQQLHHYHIYKHPIYEYAI